MASYFELPPQQNDEAATIGQVPEEERKQLGRMSLMSPAVTQLLEDLGNEDSDSSSEDNSLSEGEDAIGPKKGKSEPSGPSRQDEKRQSQDPERKPSALSPSRSPAKPVEGKGTSHVKSPSVRTGGGNSSKKKPAHMARFHSLRSMLFQANIEDKMKSTTKEDCRKQEEAANQWKSQHDQRQMHRPKTPEKEQQEKEGLGSRLKTKIRRMTSKEVPTLQNIGEDDAAVGKFDDRASTASSDADEGVQRNTWQDEISDSESINHSDVEELVRWVSRRDPPSDGEARKSGVVRHEIVEDSGHESLGHSDVEDLVRWVSHRSDAKETSNQYTGYSDASTESDSEVARHSSDEEDADDLVRWISRRDGPKAGPVRLKLTKEDLDSDVERHYDSDVPELGRWFQRHDDTSGESAASSPVRGERLVFDNDEEEQRGRPRSRESHSPNKLTRNHLTHEDVDELVRWVSRKDPKQQEQIALENDDRVLEWKRQEDEKKKQLGMTVDEGSLSHSDVKELIEHVRTNSFQAVQGSNISAEAETGDLRALRAGRDEIQVIKQDEEKKKQQLGMTVDEGSLSHSDMQDLIEHVRKDSSSPQNDLYSMNTKEKDAAEFASKGHSQPSRGESKQIDSKDFNVDKAEDRVHRDSLGEEDVDELVKWVSAKH